MKRIASNGGLEIGAVLLAVLSAACVLEPASNGRPEVARSPSPSWPEGHLDAPLDAEASRAPAKTAFLKSLDAIPVISPFVGLPVTGFPDAVVGLPAIEEAGRPVIVVLHGLGGRPEPNCRAWRDITEAAGYALCLRGDFDAERSGPGDPRYTLAGGWVLRKHLETALAALRARFGGGVDVDHPLLAGFSLGAAEVALLAQSDPARFRRIAVIEGGLDAWVEPTIAPFAARGGERVLFGCGSSWCTPPALAAASRIGNGGASARVVYADVGHRNSPPLQRAIRSELGWLVEGDARWQALASAVP